MVLEVIIAILLFLAGALLYTFGILRVLLCYTSAIPLTIMFLLLQKHIVQSIAVSGIKQ